MKWDKNTIDQFSGDEKVLHGSKLVPMFLQVSGWDQAFPQRCPELAEPVRDIHRLSVGHKKEQHRSEYRPQTDWCPVRVLTLRPTITHSELPVLVRK